MTAEQLSLDQRTKEELAIEFIRQYGPREGYYVGFSGGKDSVVLVDLVRKSEVKHELHYSATGIDPPEVTRFIRRNYPEVSWHHPKVHFFKILPKRGFPTKMTRWCCDYLKKDPTKHVLLNHKLMGIRAEESAKRSKRGKINKDGKQVLYNPLFDWLEWEIWEYIESHNLGYCKLYEEGFGRIGCVVCPFLCNPNQGKLNQHKRKWPKYYMAFEKAMLRLWNDKEHIKQKEKGYANNFNEFLDNWYKGNHPKVDENQLRMGWDW